MEQKPVSHWWSFSTGFMIAALISGVMTFGPRIWGQQGIDPATFFQRAWELGPSCVDTNGNGVLDFLETGLVQGNRMYMYFQDTGTDGPDFWNSDQELNGIYSAFPERCTNGHDDDQDGSTDCNDIQCAQHNSACQQGASGMNSQQGDVSEICGNGKDDNGKFGIDEYLCIPAAGDNSSASTFGPQQPGQGGGNQGQNNQSGNQGQGSYAPNDGGNQGSNGPNGNPNGNQGQGNQGNNPAGGGQGQPGSGTAEIHGSAGESCSCRDGTDNDSDWLVDGADPECQLTTSCDE